MGAGGGVLSPQTEGKLGVFPKENGGTVTSGSRNGLGAGHAEARERCSPACWVPERLELNFKDLCWEMKGGGSGKTLDGVPWPAGGHWGSSPGRVPV